MKTTALPCLLLLCILFSSVAFGQNSVGIGTENSNNNAVLELVSPGNDQGFLVPRLTTSQRTATSFTNNLGTNENGLLVFDSDEKKFYYWYDNAWRQVQNGPELTAGTGIAINSGVIINTGDTDATDDFSGDFNDLINIPVNLDTDLTDDFDGSFTSLTDIPPNLDTDVTDDFDGNFSSLAGIPAGLSDGDNIDDADADPLNEIQDLNLSGNTLTITNNPTATPIDLSAFSGENTDNQTLSFLSNQLSITGGNTVDLSALINDADADPLNELQDISIATDIITITGSTSTIDLTPYLDNTDNQDLSLTSDLLSLTGDATTVDLSIYRDNTDAQTLDLLKASLIISNGNSVDLSAFLDNTDAQELSLSTNTLSISGGTNTVDLSGYLDNTDAQDLALDGATNILSLTNDGTPVDLSGYLDNTDAQNLGSTASGTLRDITISGGTGTTIDVADGDASQTNEIQDLSLTSNTLSLSGDGTSVDLSGYLDNTDSQELSLATNTLSLSGGTNTVDLSGYMDNTDAQDLALDGATNILSLTNDGTPVDLSAYLDNTDAQSLGFTATGTDRTITITGGTGTTISVADNDNSSINELQTLTRSGNSLSISSGNAVTVVDQVAFRATKLPEAIGAGQVTLTFENLEYDLTGSFDLATSTFKAPVPGIYNFSGVISTFFDTGVKGLLYVSVNGTIIQVFTIDSSTNESSFPFTVDLALALGDAVNLILDTTTGASIRGYSSKTNGPPFYTFWSGRLVTNLSK